MRLGTPVGQIHILHALVEELAASAALRTGLEANEGLVAFHAIVFAEAAVAIALGLEDIRVETEHEADEGLVTFQAVVLAETTGAIALILEDLHIDTEDEACKKLVAFRVLVLAEAAGAGTLKLEDLRVETEHEALKIRRQPHLLHALDETRTSGEASRTISGTWRSCCGGF